MTLEQRVKLLENQFDNLNKAFLQAQRNQVPITAKVDDSANQVKAITPYTETKTAYIGDTEIVFTDVPSGNLLIYSPIVKMSYVRLGDRLVISFEPLEEVTEITISIS
jgi:hypothetical protein